MSAAAETIPSIHVRNWQRGEISAPERLAPRLGGSGYLKLLEAAHRELQPARYFEIGIRRGRSLSLATCRSVGVDPAPALPDGFQEERPQLTVFRTTSDDFFRDDDLTKVLGGPVDLAFLDGMHRFEFLLRDFFNTEAHSAPGSVIVMHDCLPVTSEMVHRGERDPRDADYDPMPKAWAGDVWKMIPILREYRPDLRLTMFDAFPTGLVFVTQLDPASTLLRERHDDIVARYMNEDLTKIGVSAFVKSQGALPTAPAIRPGALAAALGRR